MPARSTEAEQRHRIIVTTHHNALLSPLLALRGQAPGRGKGDLNPVSLCLITLLIFKSIIFLWFQTLLSFGRRGRGSLYFFQCIGLPLSLALPPMVPSRRGFPLWQQLSPFQGDVAFPM